MMRIILLYTFIFLYLKDHIYNKKISFSNLLKNYAVLIAKSNVLEFYNHFKESHLTILVLIQ